MNKSFIISNSFFRILAPLFAGIFAYLLILLLNNDISNIPYTFKGHEVYVCIFLTYLLSESQRKLISYTHTDSRELATSKIVMQVLLGVFISITLITAAVSFYFDWFYGFSASRTQIIIFDVVYVLLTVLYHLLFISNYFYMQQNNELVTLEEQLRDDLTSDMQAYRHRVNPQLLYHSLETMITLVHKNEHEAEDFIDHLSAVYRHILSNRKKDLVPLEQELRASRHIIFLLNHEYNNLIYIKENFATDLNDIYIIPGALTMLIEQIVRRNIITPLSPMHIEISDEAEDGYLVLRNTLNERLYQSSSFDALFDSLQKSYYYYSEKPIVMVKADRDNFLKLPLLKEAKEKAEYAIL